MLTNTGGDLFFLTRASRNSSGGRFDHQKTYSRTRSFSHSLYFFLGAKEDLFPVSIPARMRKTSFLNIYIYIGLYPISYVLRLRMLLVLKQQKDTTEFSCDTDGSHSMVSQSLAMRLFLPLC